MYVQGRVRSKTSLELNSLGIRECYFFGILVGCGYVRFLLLTQTHYSIMEDTDKNPVLARVAKKGQISGVFP